MKDEIKEIYLSNLNWTKTLDNIGVVNGNIIFKNSISLKEFEKILENTYVILCDKDYITNLQEEKDKYKNVIDKIKEYCKDKIQEQKEMVDFSKYYLENYDKAINIQHLSHSGVMLETIKSTTIKRYENILELLEEVK